jgi:hypothetical protein
MTISDGSMAMAWQICRARGTPVFPCYRAITANEQGNILFFCFWGAKTGLFRPILSLRTTGYASPPCYAEQGNRVREQGKFLPEQG